MTLPDRKSPSTDTAQAAKATAGSVKHELQEIEAMADQYVPAKRRQQHAQQRNALQSRAQSLASAESGQSSVAGKAGAEKGAGGGFLSALRPQAAPAAARDKVRVASLTHSCLEGHYLKGEERFNVEWHQADDSVWCALRLPVCK